jgi:hypothetical protein
MAFPFDIFTRLFEGDWIAWTTLALFIVVVGLACFLIILWWKMPQFAKAGFINNLVSHRPVVVECYENKKIVFQLPQLFRNGLGYFKGIWSVFPKLWVGANEDLKDAERQAVNAVYSGDGCPAGLYFNYVVQAQVVNPELLVIVQHEREIQRLNVAKDALRDAFSREVTALLTKEHYSPEQTVELQNQIVKVFDETVALNNVTDTIKIDKELFIAALKHIKDKTVQLQPMNLNLPIDIRGLKTMMPKALPQSTLGELENKVKEIMRRAMGIGGNKTTVLVILLVISVIIGIVSLLHDYKVF